MRRSSLKEFQPYFVWSKTDEENSLQQTMLFPLHRMEKIFSCWDNTGKRFLIILIAFLVALFVVTDKIYVKLDANFIFSQLLYNAISKCSIENDKYTGNLLQIKTLVIQIIMENLLLIDTIII